MSDQSVFGDDFDDDDLDYRRSSGRLSGKRLVLLILLPLLILAIAGAVFFFVTNDGGKMMDDLLGGSSDSRAPAAVSQSTSSGSTSSDDPAAVATGAGLFLPLPEMLVNLNSTDRRRPNYLKMSVALELQTAEDEARIQAMMPKIIDEMQVYLRELRVDDLRGSAGLHRLREEMTVRVNKGIAPARVNQVLFQQMLVQ